MFNLVIAYYIVDMIYRLICNFFERIMGFDRSRVNKEIPDFEAIIQRDRASHIYMASMSLCLNVTIIYQRLF